MKLWLFSLALCLAAGGGYLADLLLFTDPATGFAAAGSVWLRYGALVLAVFLVWLFSFSLGRAARADRGRRSRVMTLAFAAAAAGFALSAVLFALSATLFGAVQAVLLGAGAFWCGVCSVCFHRGLRQPLWGIWPALAALMALFSLSVGRFAMRPTTIQRVAPTLVLLASLAAMVFCCRVMRWLYLPEQPGFSRRLFFWGMVCFLLCFALSGAIALCGPQQGSGVVQAVPVMLSLGLLGAAAALRAVRITRRLPRRMREM